MFSVMEETLNLCLYFPTYADQTAFGGFMFLTNKYIVPNPFLVLSNIRPFLIHFNPIFMDCLFMVAFPSGSVVKNPPVNAEDAGDTGSITGWDDPLEEGTETHCSILACRIHGQRSLVGYSPWGRRVGRD